MPAKPPLPCRSRNAPVPVSLGEGNVSLRSGCITPQPSRLSQPFSPLSNQELDKRVGGFCTCRKRRAVRKVRTGEQSQVWPGCHFLKMTSTKRDWIKAARDAAPESLPYRSQILQQAIGATFPNRESGRVLRSRVAPKTDITGLASPNTRKNLQPALEPGKLAEINTTSCSSRARRSHVAPESWGAEGSSMKDIPDSLLPLAIKTQPARTAWTLTKCFARSRVAPNVALIGKVQRKRGVISSTCQAALSGKIPSLCLDLPSITLRRMIQEKISPSRFIGPRTNLKALPLSWERKFSFSTIRPDKSKNVFVFPDASREHATGGQSKNPDSTGNECANPLIVAPFTLPSRSHVAPAAGFDWNFKRKNTVFSQPLNNKGLTCRDNAAWNHDTAPFGIHPPPQMGDRCGWEASKTRTAHAQSDAVLSAGREDAVTLDGRRYLKIIRTEKSSQLPADTQPDHVQTRGRWLSPSHVRSWNKWFANSACVTLSPVKRRKMSSIFSMLKKGQNPVHQKNILQNGQKIVKNLSLPLRSPYAPLTLPCRSRGRSRLPSTRRLKPQFRRHGYIDMEKHKSWLYASPDKKSGLSRGLKIGEKTALTAPPNPARTPFFGHCHPARLRLSSSRDRLCPRPTLVKTIFTMPDRPGQAWIGSLA